MKMSVAQVEATQTTTHTTEFFIQAVEGVVKQLCRFFPALRPDIQRLARTFQLNELELTAWAFVLKKTLYGESEEKQRLSLLYSAYLSKSLLSRNTCEWKEALLNQDPDFQTNYTSWLAVHQRCTELSLSDLHRQFKDLWNFGKLSHCPENLNLVVDSLVHAKTLRIEELHVPQSDCCDDLLHCFPQY